jgi:hypothetical protein
MARPASWHPRIPQVLEELERSSLPVLDRFTVQRLFGVERRQALRLMQRWGGYQAGRTQLIERKVLAEALRGLQGAPEVRETVRRKRSLWTALQAERAAWKARRVTIASLPFGPRRFPDWPEGIEWQPGALSVRYTHPLELAERLYAFGQMLAENFEAFAALHPHTGPALPGFPAPQD